MDIRSIERITRHLAQTIGPAAPGHITQELGYWNAEIIKRGISQKITAVEYTAVEYTAVEYTAPHEFVGKLNELEARLYVQHLTQACLNAFNPDHECWRFVGGGYFSGVVRHTGEPGVVFKISMRPDDAYKAYALWVRQNPGKHFPVIYSIHHIGNVAVYALKEYSPLTMLPDFNTWDFLERERAHRPNHVYRRSLCSAVGSVRKFFKGVAAIDIHGENLMFDPETKQVIITDPVSFNKEGDYCVAEPS